MKALRFPVSLFFLFSCFISLVLSLDDLPKKCLDDQRSSLLQLQHDLFYDPNFSFSSKFELWDANTDCCLWEGITCDALGHVIGLDLSYKNISGTFHSIFDLHHLHQLNLAGNNFNTTLLSYGFDKLQNLTHLNLSSSCFHGQIPVEISFLTRLVSLDLSNKKDCYDSPTLKLEKPNIKTLIKNLRNLTELYLDGVDISFQSIKWCKTTYLVLSKLQVLSLSNCGLEGPLCSALSKLPFLSKLVLDNNPISYLPPKFLNSSSRLVSLSLRDCSLSGHFPTEVLLLPNIQSIDISGNYDLMGQLPEFPSNSALRILSLSGSNFSGKLPESIGDLKFLTDLFLYDCHFSGSIPSSIANLSQLVILDLSGNNLSGLIPPFHRFGVPNLSYLYLEENKLSGPISSSLFTLPSLQVLSLNKNELVGKIHDFPNASSSLIKELDLGNNNLTGPIPNSILQLPKLERLYIGDNSFSSMKLNFVKMKNLRHLDLSNISLLIESINRSVNFPQLETLRLSSCNLNEFPGFIKTLDKLVEIDLSNNHIHGVVPNWLWKTTLLWVDLSSNPIDFPKQLPLSDANFSFPMLRGLFMESCNISAFPEFLRSQEELQYLNLANNGISGAIPNWVWKKSLLNVNLSNNHLSYLDQLLSNHSLTSSQDSLLRPICDISQVLYFDASHNNLSGPIPNCLGNMSALQHLDLHGNNFSGTLPDFANSRNLWLVKVSENRMEGKLQKSLAECTQLEVLDVGNNMLRDTFPFWLQKLPWLTVLILRENRFHGEIKHFKHKIVFPTLDVLDIASNEFSGKLYIDFFRASQLRSLKISGNKLEGKLPRSLATCSKLEVLDLGNNMVHDTFPIWLIKLPSLKVLILRENKFHGTIEDFDTGQGFQNLRILDIAFNYFSGDLTTEFLQFLKAMTKMSNDNKTELGYIGGHYSGGEYYEDSVTIVNKGIEIFYFCPK